MGANNSIPTGPYQSTCTNITYSDNILSGACKDNSGTVKPLSTLNMYTCGPGDIYNNNGVLSCNRYLTKTDTDKLYQPMGDYLTVKAAALAYQPKQTNLMAGDMTSQAVTQALHSNSNAIPSTTSPSATIPIAMPSTTVNSTLTNIPTPMSGTTANLTLNPVSMPSTTANSTLTNIPTPMSGTTANLTLNSVSMPITSPSTTTTATTSAQLAQTAVKEYFRHYNRNY